MRVTVRPQPSPARHAQCYPQPARDPEPQPRPVERTAILMAAHNEEPVIGATLRSLLYTVPAEDIHVFCDGCSDNTVAVCRAYLPAQNVIEGDRNLGKSRALQFMLKSRIQPLGYTYVAIVDADTTVERDFLTELLKRVRQDDVAAVSAHVEARWEQLSIYSMYRTYMYMIWQLLFKTILSFFNAVTVATGCATIWKVSILKDLDFDHGLSTEDFNLTLQVHRRRLGRIVYTRSTTVWTQDPFSFRAFYRQTYRWSRAWWECARKYHVGLRPIRFRGIRPSGVNALDILFVLMAATIYAFWLRTFAITALLVFPHDFGVRPILPATRADALVDAAWLYGILVFTFFVVAVAKRRPLIAFFTPVLILLAAVDFVANVVAALSVLHRLYRRPAGSSQVSQPQSAWVSPERRPIA